MTDFLILYVREDGAFARLSAGGTVTAAERRTEISEDSLGAIVSGLLSELVGERELKPRSVTAAYTLGKRVEMLSVTLSEILTPIPYIDSVTNLPREQVFYVAAAALSEESPGEVLFCGSRETRLFSGEGEYELPSMSTGGNGFLDLLFAFTEHESDSPEYLFSQRARLYELFSVYLAYPVASGGRGMPETVLFPDPEAHSRLTFRVESPKHAWKAHRAGEEIASAEESVQIEGKTVSEAERIRYYALKESDKAKVDRRMPAFYRSTRDKRGSLLKVSIGDVAEEFSRMLSPLKDAPITSLTLVGQYAGFPLLRDLMRSFGSYPIHTMRESLLVLRGMERLLLDAICDSRLSVIDMNGNEIVLWDVSMDDDAPEKRVSFPVILKTVLDREELEGAFPVLPYRLEQMLLRKKEGGAFLYERTVTNGDLFDFCYDRRGDGTATVRFSDGGLKKRFVTVLLGIGATPTGVIAHITGR